MLVPGAYHTGTVTHQDGVSASADGEVITMCVPSVGALARWVVQITGTFTADVHFEGTVDGTNWVALEMESLGASGTKATSANAPGIWRGDVLGLHKVRARVAWTSGTSVTVVGEVTA